MIPFAPSSPATGPTVNSIRSVSDQKLFAAAQKLEAAFLSEMLKHAGVGAVSETFGGGAGEEHFASFLRDEQAAQMVSAGGIGIAEALFEAMKARGDE